MDIIELLDYVRISLFGVALDSFDISFSTDMEREQLTIKISISLNGKVLSLHKTHFLSVLESYPSLKDILNNDILGMINMMDLSKEESK